MQWTRTEFFGRKSMMHGKIHYGHKFNDLLACQKMSAYLKNVVKCLPICKVSSGDVVEMLQIAPPRKNRHSTHNFATVRYLFEK